MDLPFPLVESGAISPQASTYIDITVMNSVLAGLVVLVAALWALYVFSRLWQQSLLDDAREALQAAPELGLAVAPLRTGPKVVASGQVGGRAVRVEWRGGIWGAHSVVVAGGHKTVHPLLADSGSLAAAVGHRDPVG